MHYYVRCQCIMLFDFNVLCYLMSECIMLFDFNGLLFDVIVYYVI